MVEWLEMGSRVSIMILNTQPEFVLGTIHARTHVQLALACRRSMLCAQHRLRLTMQHVYGHSVNLGNECADHAAALGTFGPVSSHNASTRWVRHNFDASVCFDGCKNATSLRPNWSQRCVAPSGSLSFLYISRAFFVLLVILLSAFFLRMGTLSSRTSNGKLFFICHYRAEF